MKKRLTKLIIILILSLTIAQAVAAHPLGNFTISRYSRLELSDESVNVTYLVDMAEIPTFQERQLMDIDGNEMISDAEISQYLTDNVPQFSQNLHFELNGELIPLQVTHRELLFTPGQGDLPTLRMELDLTAVIPTSTTPRQLNYSDNNFANRLGWQEIVVKLDDGIELINSAISTQDVSNGLTSYPDDLLQNPLQISSVSFQFAPIGIAAQLEVEADRGAESPIATLAATDSQNRFSQDEFANLLTTTLDNPGAIAIALIVALGLGAAHALTPGHGKTIVGAYLVGSRGTAKHALFLGLTTTITHTAGVFLFGFIVLFASKFILPEQLYPWLGVMSGALVVIIGFSLFRGHLRTLRNRGQQHDAHHSHSHDFDHDHDHDHYHAHEPHTHFGGVTHTHAPPEDMEMSWRNLLALGISGGLLPCPSALILLLSAIALNKVGFGLLLIVAFSIGLAGILTGIGLMMVYAGQFFQNRMPKGNGRLLQILPVASALFITIAGLAITIQAFSDTGVI